MAMRLNQIYAVKAARKRIVESNQSSYVFACTRPGKALASFKLAQLPRNESAIDKVIFLIDRKDLDDQTVNEYNFFVKDCMDNSDCTTVLAMQMKEPGRILLVTTIQKIAIAVKSKPHEDLMEQYRHKKIVKTQFIIPFWERIYEHDRVKEPLG